LRFFYRLFPASQTPFSRGFKRDDGTSRALGFAMRDKLLPAARQARRCPFHPVFQSPCALPIFARRSEA
jgi:hypothetical protein